MCILSLTLIFIFFLIRLIVILKNIFNKLFLVLNFLFYYYSNIKNQMYRKTAFLHIFHIYILKFENHTEPT